MPDKKVVKLKLTPEFDFLAFAIASHQKDYRLTWAVNQALNISLSQSKPFKYSDSKRSLEQEFVCYTFTENAREYTLISNFSEKGHLLPEYKNINFVLIISGSHKTLDHDLIVKKLKDVSIIISAFEVDVPKLKSKKKLADF